MLLQPHQYHAVFFARVVLNGMQTPVAVQPAGMQPAQPGSTSTFFPSSAALNVTLVRFQLAALLYLYVPMLRVMLGGAGCRSIDNSPDSQCKQDAQSQMLDHHSKNL